MPRDEREYDDRTDAVDTVRHYWPKSMWLTRKESMSIEINGQRIERESSFGMSIETDLKTGGGEMRNRLVKAVTVAMNEERESYLSEEIMKLRMRDTIRRVEEGVSESTNDDRGSADPGGDDREEAGASVPADQDGQG